MHHTRGPTGEGKDNDVIEGPGIVFVRWMESQFLGAFLPQVHQHGGVYHRHWVTALSVPMLGGEVLCCTPVVALRTTQT